MTDADAGQMAPGNAVATVQGGIVARTCAHCGGPLQRRQRRFCSDPCRTTAWDLVHPRLNIAPPEGRRKVSIRVALLNLLSDGEWRTVLDMAADLRSEPHSVSARLSQVRKMGERTGQWVIEADLPDGNATRPHRFRMVSRG
jgi:hypothetical protein